MCHKTNEARASAGLCRPPTNGAYCPAPCGAQNSSQPVLSPRFLCLEKSTSYRARRRLRREVLRDGRTGTRRRAPVDDPAAHSASTSNQDLGSTKSEGLPPPAVFAACVLDNATWRNSTSTPARTLLHLRPRTAPPSPTRRIDKTVIQQRDLCTSWPHNTSAAARRRRDRREPFVHFGPGFRRLRGRRGVICSLLCCRGSTG